jgi:hypothetical protein
MPLMPPQSGQTKPAIFTKIIFAPTAHNSFKKQIIRKKRY